MLPHRLQALRGPGASNIVLKDFCLVGPHPGSSPQEVVASLTPLLRAGVTTFVCLQADMPRPGAPHPSMRRDRGGAIQATREWWRCWWRGWVLVAVTPPTVYGVPMAPHAVS